MSTANGGEPSAGTRRAAVSIAVAAVAIDAALLGLIAPLLPAIQERTGAGDGALGLALAAYAVPIALLSLPLGRAADRIGRRLLLLGGLALVAAGSVFVAASDSFGALIAARVVQGIGSASSWIAALALVSDSAPEGKRGQWLGVALGATSVGSIAGPALGGVAADVLSFEAPFLIFAGARRRAPDRRVARPSLGGAAVAPGGPGAVGDPALGRIRHRRLERHDQPHQRRRARADRGRRAAGSRRPPRALERRDRTALRRVDRGRRRALARRRALGRSPRAPRARDHRPRGQRPLGPAPRGPPRRRRDGDRARRLRGGVQPRVRRSGSLARRGLRGDRARARLRRPEPALRRRLCDRPHHRRGAARARGADLAYILTAAALAACAIALAIARPTRGRRRAG